MCIRDRPKSIADGIHAVRMVLPKCYFDANLCKSGIEALTSYERRYDTKLKVYMDKPLHNWASNGADAFRVFAEGYQPGFGKYSEDRLKLMPELAEHEWDPFN